MPIAPSSSQRNRRAELLGEVVLSWGSVPAGEVQGSDADPLRSVILKPPSALAGWHRHAPQSVGCLPQKFRSTSAAWALVPCLAVGDDRPEVRAELLVLRSRQLRLDASAAFIIKGTGPRNP
jgi:hypothetical protein